MWGEQMTSLMAVADLTFGLQMVLLGTLVAITIFRKEMSCNRCYAAEQDEQSRAKSLLSPPRNNGGSHVSSSASNGSHSKTEERSWDEGPAERFLEGAGCYYSSMGTTTYHVLLRLGQQVWTWRAWKSLSSWWRLAAEDQRFDEVLDGAEHWCVVRCPPSPPLAASFTSEEDPATAEPVFPHAPCLPTESMVHILSFLHPRDVVSLACTSQRMRSSIDNDSNECSIAVWKTLWYRDYSWLLLAWDVGRDAALRSLSHERAARRENTVSLQRVSFTKEFYLRFGLSFLEYVLAGQCTSQRCLVGLGGHIYDLTSFLDQHPGSPETVMVHAGRDASAVFESMRHTSAARTMAQMLCVVVNVSCETDSAGAGVRPTPKLVQLDKPDVHVPARAAPRKPHGCPLPSSGVSTLQQLKREFAREQEMAQQRTRRRLARLSDAVFGEAHAFYDPLQGAWKAWYMNTNMQPVFLDDI